jgi:predicted transcriptional regulator
LKSKLEELQSRKLIFRVNGSFEKKVYQISENGIRFLKAYEHMKELYDKNSDIASRCLKNELLCT